MRNANPGSKNYISRVLRVFIEKYFMPFPPGVKIKQETFLNTYHHSTAEPPGLRGRDEKWSGGGGGEMCGFLTRLWENAALGENKGNGGRKY